MARMPKQAPGSSKQDYQTPPEFLIAVRSLLGIDDFIIDLAASAENAVTELYYDEAMNALEQPWANIPSVDPCQFCTQGLSRRWADDAYVHDVPVRDVFTIVRCVGGWNWLNPEFKEIEPWVRKAYAAMQMGGNTAVLLPLSTFIWWHRWVHGKAHVKLLGGEKNSGRITFVGETTAYPKDCALLLYGEPEKFPVAYDTWDWVAEYETATGQKLPVKKKQKKARDGEA